MKAQQCRLYAVLSALTIVGLLLGACAPRAAPTPVPAPAPTLLAPTRVPPPTPAASPPEEKPRYGGVLVLGVSLDIPSFDPQSGAQAVTSQVVYGSYNNLIRFDPRVSDLGEKIIPELAKSWEMSPDGTIYTFPLHEGVKFHDGTVLTAEDVKYSLDRMRLPVPQGVASAWKTDLAAIKMVETPDQKTVRIVLKYPSASFLAMLAGPNVVVHSKALADREGKEIHRAKVMGTGPFLFKEYSGGVAYVAVRNPDYFVPGLPYLDGVKGYIIRDAAARLAALRTGQIHMIRQPGITVAEVQVLKAQLGDKVVVQEKWSSNSVSANMVNLQKKPFGDVRVRKAISLALNREGYGRIIRPGGFVVGGPMYANGPWSLPKDELIKYPGYGPDMEARIAEAKRLLAEAGYPDGFETVISARMDHRDHIQKTEYTIAELRKVGIKAKARLMESGLLYLSLEKGEYDMAAAGFGQTLDDPDSILGPFYVKGGGRNYMRYSDPRVEELFAKQAQTLDREKRKEIVQEIQRIVLRDAVMIHWGHEVVYKPHSAAVKGWVVPNGWNHNHARYDMVWLAE